jgi:hypothetical protein
MHASIGHMLKLYHVTDADCLVVIYRHNRVILLSRETGEENKS